MSKINSIPPIVQQAIENMLDDKNSDNVRFNNKVMLQNIIDCSQSAITAYEKKTLLKKFK